MRILKALLICLVVVTIPLIPDVQIDAQTAPPCFNHLGEQIDCGQDGRAPGFKTDEQQAVIDSKIQEAQSDRRMDVLHHGPCDRVFTWMRHTAFSDDAYDVRIWLQGLGWGDWYELRNFGPPAADQDTQLDNILTTMGPFDEHDLIMIRMDGAAWWNYIDQQTMNDLNNSGARIVVIGEFYGFIGSDGADFIDSLPPSFVVDRSYDILSETDSSLWLQPWNNDEWFRTWDVIGDVVAGPTLATGNVWSEGNVALSQVVRSTPDGSGRHLTLIAEDGMWRIYMDSSGVGDLAVWYYGDGTVGDLWQQQLIWSCQAYPGAPTSVKLSSIQTRSSKMFLPTVGNPAVAGAIIMWVLVSFVVGIIFWRRKRK